MCPRRADQVGRQPWCGRFPWRGAFDAGWVQGCGPRVVTAAPSARPACMKGTPGGKASEKQEATNHTNSTLHAVGGRGGKWQGWESEPSTGRLRPWCLTYVSASAERCSPRRIEHVDQSTVLVEGLGVRVGGEPWGGALWTWHVTSLHKISLHGSRKVSNISVSNISFTLVSRVAFQACRVGCTEWRSAHHRGGDSVAEIGGAHGEGRRVSEIKEKPNSENDKKRCHTEHDLPWKKRAWCSTPTEFRDAQVGHKSGPPVYRSLARTSGNTTDCNNTSSCLTPNDRLSMNVSPLPVPSPHEANGFQLWDQQCSISLDVGM
jgi:hypothetical protein